MNRIPTTLALSGWLGYFAVVGLDCTLSALGVVPLDAASGSAFTQVLASMTRAGELPFALQPAAHGASALAAIGLAASFAAALIRLHSPTPSAVRTGERVAVRSVFAAAVATACLPLSLLWMGLPVWDGLGLWAALLASLCALGFDHAVAPMPHDDDRDFERGISALAAGMALQTRLYPVSGTTRQRENLS